VATATLAPQSTGVAYSRCDRPACYAKVAGHVLRCPKCGNSRMIFRREAATPAARPPMSLVEQQARAIARAHDERVHIFAVPGRPGVYVTRSKSNPSERYSLVALDGIVACSCKGYEHRKVCKHVAALENRLAREATRSTRPLVAVAA
jgi:hypothetical protein